MKVIVKGSGEVSLTQRNFVAAGGQASVYVKDGVAFKLYTDPRDMIPDAKFHALAAIQDKNIVRPDKVVYDDAQKPIGYTMAAIPDSYSLCQLFTRAFRDRNGVTGGQVIELAAKLREHVENVHQAKILIVDLNELNILVSKKFEDAFFIDVDSYQTPGYPATVIMPSVRDYSVRAADFSPLSDWFSYAVLTFQLFVGSHPYKGTHAGSAAIEKDQRLLHRMKNHISAFQSDVSLPKCCYAFDQIPTDFRAWLKAVLQDGKRLAPPDPRIAGVLIAPTIAAAAVSSGNVTIALVLDLEGDLLVSYAESAGATIVARAPNQPGAVLTVLMDGRNLRSAPTDPGTNLVGFTPKMNQPIGFNLNGEKLTFFDYTRRTAETLPIRAQEIAKSGDRFYVKNGPRILELEFSELPAKTLVMASREVASVLEMASKLYEGCVIQNMLGSVFVSLFPRSRAGYQVRIPELDEYKIVDAKFDGGVLMVVGAKAGQYDRLVFRFDVDCQVYDLRVVADISPAGVNFITLDSGVCVCLTEDEKLEAFSAKKGATGMKIVEDAAIDGNARLMKVQGKAGFERGGKIYQLAMK